jgi:hypothetical protein
MEKKQFRLQIAFDIKDENGRSVLKKETLNTASCAIHGLPTQENIDTLYWSILQVSLSRIEEMKQFHHLFYLDVRFGESSDNNQPISVERPIDFQGYHSTIHTVNDSRLTPCLDTSSWINQGIVARTRLFCRKIQYSARCFFSPNQW